MDAFPGEKVLSALPAHFENAFVTFSREISCRVRYHTMAAQVQGRRVAARIAVVAGNGCLPPKSRRPRRDRPDLVRPASTFHPPAHAPRFVLRKQCTLVAKQRGKDPQTVRTDFRVLSARAQITRTPNIARAGKIGPITTTGYASSARPGQQPYSTSPFVAPEAAKKLEDLRSLCRLCHDAVTMIEYGLGMGLDRIDPEETRWRDDFIKARGRR